MRNTTHSKVLAYILLLPPFGLFGFHRFFLNQKWWGLLYLCTLGILGLGVVFDIFYMPKFFEKSSRLEKGDVDYNLCWILFVFTGVLGLHKLYLGKPLMFFFYLSSLGFLGLGLVYDLFTLNKQINKANCLYPLNFNIDN